MKYTAGCVGKNGKTYTVEIITNNDATTAQKLTLVAGGLVVRIDGTGDLFTPLRGGSASITVRTDELLTDIYSAGAIDVPVTIYEDNALMFFGYVIPCVYNQPLAGRSAELTIEARNALSALTDLNFDLDAPSATFSELVEAAIARVDKNHVLTYNIASPFTTSFSSLAISSANWYDEAGEPMKWGEALAGVLQWAGARVVQWRDTVVVVDARQIGNAVELDNISANASPSISLTEVKKKCKINVSLYEEADTIIDFFDNWELESTERVYFADIKGVPESWDAQMAFYTSPNIITKRYDTSFSSPEELANNASALSQHFGAWLIASTSGQFKQPSGQSNIEESQNYDNVKKYIVIATPVQQMPWRGALLSKSNAYFYPALTFKDDTTRVYNKGQMLVIDTGAWLTSNPSPVLCRALDGKYYNGSTGKVSNYTTEGPPAIMYRIRIGDKELGTLTDGQSGTIGVGWYKIGENDSNPLYSNRNSIALAKTNVKNPFDKTLACNKTNTGVYIGSEGLTIGLADGLEGAIEIDLLLSTGGAQLAEYAYLESFKVSLGYWPDEKRDKLLSDLGELKDVEFENITDGEGESHEIGTIVSSKISKYKYSRSTVYNTTPEGLVPVEQVTSAITGEQAFAEHHLLDHVAKQMGAPRMILQGTWRNHIATPLARYHSEALGRNFLVDALEVDCDNSTSTLTLEELL